MILLIIIQYALAFFLIGQGGFFDFLGWFILMENTLIAIATAFSKAISGKVK